VANKASEIWLGMCNDPRAGAGDDVLSRQFSPAGVRAVALIASFRDLQVWKKAITLAEAAYGLTSALPRREQFELAAQIRRAAASVPANIAEGHNRRARRAYANHIAIALGSLAEVESHVELAIRLGLFSPANAQRFLEQAAEVNRMLHGLARALAQPPQS
jgi:four helix bundle protein